MSDDKPIRLLANAAFRFIVDVGNDRQGAFTECALPTIEWDIEEVKEGGLNTYIHQLPGRRKSARVSLKNGVGKSGLLEWYFQSMKEQFARKNVTITLLDMQLKPVMVWELNEAYPVKWTGPQLKTDNNTIAIQTLDLACGEITVKFG
jgi:phage tail-like protein